MDEQIDETQMQQVLGHAVIMEGGRAGFARVHKLSRSYVTDLMKARRPISDRVADILGYVRTVHYTRKVEDNAE